MKVQTLKPTHERDWAAIERLYRRGTPLREIEGKTGVPFSTIRKRAKRLYWDQMGKLQTPKQALDKVKELLPLVAKPPAAEDLAHQESACGIYETLIKALQRAADLLGKHPDPRVAKEIALATEIAEKGISRIKGLVDGRSGGEAPAARFVVLVPMQAESIDAWRNQARVLDVTPQTVESPDD